MGGIRVLDFACGIGANSTFFKDIGCEVYGIDSSPSAIERCIKNGFSDKRFRCVNILEKNKSLSEIFKIKFDLIIALNVLPYFDDNDISHIMDQFRLQLNEQGIFMANMYTEKRTWKIGQTTNTCDMISVETSGSVNEKTYLNLVKGKEDVRKLFSSFFMEIAVTHYIVEDLDGESESVYYFGKRVNTIEE